MMQGGWGCPPPLLGVLGVPARSRARDVPTGRVEVGRKTDPRRRVGAGTRWSGAGWKVIGSPPPPTPGQEGREDAPTRRGGAYSYPLRSIERPAGRSQVRLGQVPLAGYRLVVVAPTNSPSKGQGPLTKDEMQCPPLRRHGSVPGLGGRRGGPERMKHTRVLTQSPGPPHTHSRGPRGGVSHRPPWPGTPRSGDSAPQVAVACVTGPRRGANSAAGLPGDTLVHPRHRHVSPGTRIAPRAGPRSDWEHVWCGQDSNCHRARRREPSTPTARPRSLPTTPSGHGRSVASSRRSLAFS